MLAAHSATGWSSIHWVGQNMDNHKKICLQKDNLKISNISGAHIVPDLLW